MIVRKKITTLLALLAAVLLMTAVCVPAETSVPVQAASGGRWEQTKQGIQYLNTDGKAAAATWLTQGGKLFFAKADGYLAKGWFRVEGETYYAKADGAVQTSGWKQIGKKYYYFKANGSLVRSARVGDYCVDASGVRVRNGWAGAGGKYYFCTSNGKIKKNAWFTWKKGTYYVNANGEMAINCWVRHKKGYSYLGSDGRMLKNCLQDGYFINKSGQRTTHRYTEKYVFLGDSRTVGLQSAVGKPSVNAYIAKWGSGTGWLKSTGGPALKKYLSIHPKVTVFLCMGANGPEKADEYISYYRSLIAEYPRTKFYVVSVNPVQENKRSDLKGRNKKYIAINRKLRNAFPTRYLDCWAHLKDKGFTAYDGLHYTPATYRKIYQFLTSKAK